MTLPQLKLRQQLLVLLFSVGSIGLLAFVLVIMLADQHLFEEFLPENRSLRDVESRSALLLQNYFRFMLTPELISVDELEGSIVLIRKSLGEYRQLVAGQKPKEQLVASISESIDRLEKSGQELIVAREKYTREKAEFALSKAEQVGIDLNLAVDAAIAHSETMGWRDLRESLFLSGGILLLTLVVSYLLIYGGLDRMLRPLEKLQVVITRLGKGDFQQRSRDVIRADEIGQLAVAFNRMADQLELNDEQKQEFIDQLEQKNMELERFTYTVSHELKSPLVTVNGFLGLLQKDMAADNQEKIGQDMEKISAAIDTMSRQLDDLLELSRIGRSVNPPTRFSVTALCRDVVQLMQGLIDERAAVVDIEESMPQIYADEARIREVIKNLVENGIKFSAAERSPRVEITAELRENEVLCRIRDNGPGIEPRYHEKVFGLFDRLDTAVPGTGVGLALVKRIIEIHNGSIWIESQGDGQGCCFCFTLPTR